MFYCHLGACKSNATNIHDIKRGSYGFFHITFLKLFKTAPIFVYTGSLKTSGKRLLLQQMAFTFAVKIFDVCKKQYEHKDTK